ncbi:MAG: hypothetical protein CMF60_05000 [Magnetococcales bacterium]|nr:hypothetical protein [Magnetococcales bacterium]MEC8067193.1 flagellar export chaperone FlgN [Pseudomonadota bacterium]|tara:strand:+ start:18170 stop:18604 length:435 start_codon:yes stop_codon:yes gene_type:complete
MSESIQLVTGAIESCEKFTTLLLEENKFLKARDMKSVEENIKEKRHLAAKVEKLLGAVKSAYGQIKQDSSTTVHLHQLETVINNYKVAARKNTALLQAAHTATTDFINLVRHAVDSRKPQAQTYGENGAMRQQNSSTKLVNKDI